MKPRKIAPRRKRPRLRRLLRMLLLFIGALFVLLTAEEIIFRSQDSPAHSTGRNAIWIRHSWIDNDHTDRDYRKLVDRLHRLGITDVYFHAGPLNSEGTVEQAKFSGSAKLMRQIKKLDPHIRMQPWLGQVAEFGGGGPLKLQSPTIRAEIVRTGRRFLDLGADGIHLDIEPIYSGDRNFLQLLRELHKLTKSHDAILSVAASKPEEFPGLERLVGLVARNTGYWTRDYFLDVTRQVDQVAIMSYDTGILLPGIYARTVAWDAKWAISNGVSDLYIGVPTYEAGGNAHFTWVENLNVALKGLRLGVSAIDKKDRKKVGAAIFADWTTSASEEQTFQKYWLGKQKD